MRKHIFKEGLPPSERNRKTVGYRSKIDGKIIDGLGVVANEYANPDVEASAKLIQFLKEKDFTEYNTYFSTYVKAFGNSYEIIIPFEVDTDYYADFAAVTRWVIVPNLGYDRRVEYGQRSSTKYSNFFNKSAVRLIESFGLQQLTIYTGSDRNGKDKYVGYGLCTLETHENHKSVKPIELVNKLKAFIRRLEMANAEYEKTANLGAKEYYTYKGMIPDEELGGLFYITPNEGMTTCYDVDITSDTTCAVGDDLELDLENPDILEPLIKQLVMDGVIAPTIVGEGEDAEELDPWQTADDLANEFMDDPDGGSLQIFCKEDWVDFFEILGAVLKKLGRIKDYKVEFGKPVNDAHKARLAKHPEARSKYESKKSFKTRLY